MPLSGIVFDHLAAENSDATVVGLFTTLSYLIMVAHRGSNYVARDLPEETSPTPGPSKRAWPTGSDSQLRPRLRTASAGHTCRRGISDSRRGREARLGRIKGQGNHRRFAVARLVSGRPGRHRGKALFLNWRHADTFGCRAHSGRKVQDTFTKRPGACVESTPNPQPGITRPDQ